MEPTVREDLTERIEETVPGPPQPRHSRGVRREVEASIVDENDLVYASGRKAQVLFGIGLPLKSLENDRKFVWYPGSVRIVRPRNSLNASSLVPLRTRCTTHGSFFAATVGFVRASTLSEPVMSARV